jgi:hypothetical protein
MSFRDLKEKVVIRFVDSVYDELETGFIGEWVLDNYDLEKIQFKDLLMKPTEDGYIHSKEVSDLITKFNTNQNELSKLWEVMTNIDKLFGTESWLGGRFSEDVDNHQLGIIEDILKILNVKFIQSREVV